nr:hypothetical protein [Tanacetum cinerariifolium]
MTGNRALLTNFVEKFLGTVRFGNNDFAVIVCYGDVVIGSMTIKKDYYVEGLGHKLFSVGQFYDKGLEVAFRKLCDSFDENNLFIFEDESVRISPVSKILFRKKPRNSMNVRSKNNSNQSLARTIVMICLWIIDSGCSKHMTGNRALLTNFVEKFLGTVRFGNNDFVVIAGYGDVVIGSMTIKKSTCFVRNEDGVDLLTGDRSLNLYTITLNEVASNSLTCLLAKASSSQSRLWHQRLSHLNFVTINNLEKNNLVQGLPKMKFEKDHLCSACEQGKIHQKHHKSKTAFSSIKPLHLLYMDLCGLMRVKSINGKRYVLAVVDDYLRYTWVLFLHSKDEASEVIISFIKKTQVNLQLQVQRVRTDNDTEFKNKTLAKFFDEVGNTQQFSSARTPQQNGVVERRNRNLVKAARTMLKFANLPLFLWAEAITTACFIKNRNHALLTNFVEKFLETVHFGNNDFAVIADYRDVVIGSMSIKKVYYVEGLGHNLFSIGQFCDKGLEVSFRKSTCFVRNEDGVDLLTGDRSLNLYTIARNEVASNSSTCLLTKASSLQSWLWHQRLSHLNFATINNLEKNNLVQGLPKMKFEK